MTIYKQTTYIKVNDKYKYNLVDSYSIYEMHNNERIFDFDSFVEFLEENPLPWTHIHYNWRGVITGIDSYPDFWSKKKIKNIELYTVIKTIDSKNYKIDDLRKWLNADEFIEYITCVRLDMNEFIN